MQYPFTREQLALSELTKNFMEQEVMPVAKELDAKPDPKECYPKELINKASKLGLRTLALPKEYGGIGADLTTRMLALWTGAQYEVGTIKCLSQCWKVSGAINIAGTQKQKDKWLKKFAEDHDAVCSIANSEADHTTENRLNANDPKLGLRTSAVKDGDYWIINGSKKYTSLMGHSSIILFFARTDPNESLNKGVTCFLMDGQEKGITIGPTHDKMGYRLYPNAESSYDNVRVHKDNIIGEVNQGYAVRRTFFRGSAELAACNTGLCRALFKVCHDYAKKRIQGGKPIIEHQIVRHMLAEMLMNIEVAEQFMWRVCWGVNNDPSYNSRFTRNQKVFSDKVGLKSLELALDILGGDGIMRDSPSEKIIRDLLTFQHGDGTDSSALLQSAATLDQPA